MVVAELLCVTFCLVKAALAGGGTDCNDGRYYIREDPTSCTRFYKCSNGDPFLFTCPSQLYYNPSTYNCDWPYNVKCDVNKAPNRQNGGSGANKFAVNNGQLNGNGGQNKENFFNPYNTGQYSGNNNGQYSNNQEGSTTASQGFENQNQFGDNNFLYPLHSIDAHDPQVGPTIVEPDGGFENRPRPTVDELYTSGSRSNPYEDYMNYVFDVRK